MKYAIILLTILTGTSIFGQGKSEIRDTTRPPNVILLIGDGMGLSQMSSAYFFGDSAPNYLRFNTVGLSITSSGSHRITDSAAGATALSCGEKTYNGAIGVKSDSTSAETIMEYVSDRNWKTGVVSTSSITHATPASFYAHVYGRDEELEIARQLTHSQIDFIAGSGIGYFTNRLDDKNLLDTLSANGFKWDTTALPKHITQFDTKYAFLLEQTSMKPKHLGRKEELSEMSLLALEYFSGNDVPFFLMIEGSQIDWGGHDNNGTFVVQEMLDFDKVIGLALDFAEKDGNTLVIVTADHETGGFTLAGESKKGVLNKTYDDYNSIKPTFSTGGHSATFVPVLAYGPKSALFNGIYQNTDIYFKTMQIIK